MKRVNSFGQGDHIVHLKVKTPGKLSEKQRALFTALAELEMDTPGTVAGIVKTNDGETTRTLTLLTLLRFARGYCVYLSLNLYRLNSIIYFLG